MERKLIYHEPLARVPPLPRVPPTIHWQYVLWKFLTMHEKHQSQLPICKYDIQSTQCTTVHTPLFGTASWPVQVVWFSWIVQGVWFVYCTMAKMTLKKGSHNFEIKWFVKLRQQKISVKLTGHTYVLQQFDKFWIWRSICKTRTAEIW